MFNLISSEKSTFEYCKAGSGRVNCGASPSFCASLGIPVRIVSIIERVDPDSNEATSANESPTSRASTFSYAFRLAIDLISKVPAFIRLESVSAK